MHFSARQSKATNSSSHDEASRSFTRAVSSKHPLSHPLPGQGLLSNQEGLLQRKCACGGTPGVDGLCAECRNKRLRRNTFEGDKPPPTLPALVQNMTGSPSQPLEQDTWTPINSHLGHDFSQIPLFAEARTEDMHQLAKKGIGGNAGPLPYLDQIQQSFGPRHDLNHVKAYVGSEAAVAARRMAAEAYATGDQVAFAVVPNLRVAAHEAAHVIQQRKGIQLKDGVGESGDPHEQHADAVADTVVRGGSAESLLDRMPSVNAGHASLPLVQRWRDSDFDVREMRRNANLQAEALVKQYRSDPAGLATRLISYLTTPLTIGNDIFAALSYWERVQAAGWALERFPDQASLANEIARQLPNDRVRQLAAQRRDGLSMLAMAVQRGGKGAEAERIVGILVDPAHGHQFGGTALQSTTVQGALVSHGAQIQSITGGVGPTVFDEYWIVMDAMPANLTPENYLAELSQDLNAAVHSEAFNRINIFKRTERDRKRGGPMVGDVYDIDILGPDEGSVMLVERTPQHFIFQTIETSQTGLHPEHGSREFGFEVLSDGAIRWYTRGVSRPGSDAAAMVGGPIQERGWTAMLTGIASTLQSRGGRPRPGSFGHWIRRL